ncbi:Dimethylsulfide dehydrogenase subunit alpha precursor [Slackia heliotrinireducens]|uniref:Anaerobic dehydrogenase, typically selenocysteine-containing n=1 Tax=Slackia heliotrinireducens (strain ATCC 29202 / DSM 20476 / NCTC 11029 / RHS 1) TaxID=471855 RepID=C7N7C6_SLAHD|nr:molybdopterin-dependent oxidoreductase [Slackia heliotrinireducens]ACV22811.1 anaerobic dehydrogenase, typically selenocysteine-containing [Slackia heliotrinireducens DSM 20476]VEH01524.1 Dimethylsulfide dehydrogenase subunit alpha precursor [Slackia heliotrinireducens]
MSELLKRDGLSRRTFLKGSLAAGAAAGATYLTACAPQSQGETAEETAASEQEHVMTPEEAGEQLFPGVCRGNCYGGCFLNVHVRDGKVVKTSARDLPDTQWNRICSKGLSHVYRVYDPERVKYPMKRVEGTERGAGEWEQITWDEAFDLIAEKFTGYADEFGPESVAYWYGSGNDSFVNTIQPFMNMIGASQVNQTLDNAIFYASQKTVGVGMNFNGNEMTDLVNAKTIVIWGSNPAVSQMQGMHFFMDAKEAGAKLICIDPVYSASAAKCDQWVPIKPGTDGLLAIAIMNTIIEKGWHDIDFLKAHTVAPFLVKEDGKYLRLSDLGQAEAGSETDAIVVTDGNGTFDVPENIADPAIEGTFDANGIAVTCAYMLLLERLAQYPVDQAVQMCEVPLETIEQLAEDLAVNTPSTIYMILGLDHYVNGFYNMYDILCIAALTGCAGTPGSYYGSSECLHMFYANPNAQLAVSPDAIGTKYVLPAPRMNEIFEAGEFLGNPFTLKALWSFRANIIGNMTEASYTKSWLDKVEFLVASETIMNDTARNADLVLPVAHWFEQEDFGATYPQNVYIEYQAKAIDPLYESKSDFDCIKGIADRMGLGEYFDFTPAEFFDDHVVNDLAASMGISAAALQETGAVRGLPGSAEEPFVHGAGFAFPTATGRIQFYEENPAPNMNFGQTPDLSNETLPYWESPNELPGFDDNENAGKFPFQILSDHQKLRTHTQWANVAASKEIDPEPTAKMHPDTAAERGVAEGDYIRVFNDRGSMTVLAHISEGVRPGILLCSRGWDSRSFKEGSFQSLLNHKVSEICVTQAFFDAAGDFEKVEA